MPRNGTGGYNLPSNSWNPAINGAAATAADWQSLINDVATAIQQSVSSDGQTPMTGSLQMGGFTISGLGAPTGVGQALRWEQLTKGADIASAAALPIPNEGAAFDVTGTTTITSFSGAFPGRIVYLKFDSGLTLTNSASLLMPNGKDLKPFPAEVYAFCNIDAGVWQCVGTPPRLPQRYRNGGVLTHTVNTVTVAPGAWRSADDATNLILPSSTTKTIQASGAWAAGSGNNGLFSGAISPNTWYHMFVIRNVTTGAVDAGFDTSTSAANIPAGWTAYRRVGSVFVNVSTQILPFINEGHEFRYVTPQQDVTNVGIGAATPVGISVPAGIAVLAKIAMYVNLQAARVGAAAWSTSDAARTGIANSTVTAGTSFDGAGETLVMASTTGQITVGSVFGTITTAFYLQTRSYFDFIGD
ncbi:hypothetical protein D3C87_1167380 [compost metagenome]